MSTPKSDEKNADRLVLRLIYAATLRTLLVLLGFSYAYRGDPIEIESSRQPSQLINDLSANIETFPVEFSVSGKYAGRINGMDFQIQWYEGLRRNGHIPVLYQRLRELIQVVRLSRISTLLILQSLFRLLVGRFNSNVVTCRNAWCGLTVHDGNYSARSNCHGLEQFRQVKIA